VDEFGHRLLGHLRPGGEEADGRSGVVEVLEHCAVRGPYRAVAVFGEPGDHEVVDRHERLPQQDGEVGGAFATGESRNPTCHRQAPCLISRTWTCYLSIGLTPGAPDTEAVLAVAHRNGIEMLGPIPELALAR
jgi:hypothetical protein